MNDPINLGDLSKLIGQMTSKLEEFQENAAETEAEAQAGGDLVTVRVNGKMEVLQVRLTEEAVQDRELLEDLVVAATNEAIRRVREKMAEQVSGMAGGLPLPPGGF